MKNLTFPTELILFNSALTTADFGMYGDSKKGKAMLSFKKLGLQIPGVAASAGTLPTSAAGTLSSNIVSVTKTKTTLGTVSGGLIYLKNAAPCSDCDFPYYLTFKKEVQWPGRDNFESNYVKRHYAGTIARPVISNGLIADSTLLAMEDDLIKQITADRGLATELTDKNDQAFVEARRIYTVTNDDYTDASGFTVTWADGTTYVFATASTFTAGQFAIQFNADSNVNTKLKCYRIGVETYMITSIDAGLLFTLGTLVDTTITKRGIYYKSVDKLIQVTPSMEDSFASMMLFDIATVSAYSAGTHKTSGIYNGTAFNTSATWSSNLATSVAAINTANSAGYPYYANVVGTTCVIVAIGINSFKITPSGTATVTYTVNGRGTWDYLTGDDVFRIFSAFPNTNGIQSWQRLDQPAKDSTWFKYIITTKAVDQPSAVGGAGATNSMEQKFEIYVKQSLATVDLYDATDASSFPKNWSYITSGGAGTPDENFEDILGYWSGLAISSWV